MEIPPDLRRLLDDYLDRRELPLSLLDEAKVERRSWGLVVIVHPDHVRADHDDELPRAFLLNANSKRIIETGSAHTIDDYVRLYEALLEL